MTNPLHAKYYADHAIQQTAKILEMTCVATDTHKVRLGSAEIARRVVPGQFVMLRLAGQTDPLIGRPLAVYDVVRDAHGQPFAFEVMFVVKGKMTSRLSQAMCDQALDVWGPLGNGFLPRQTEHLIMVAGGIGQTPFLSLGKEYLHVEQYGDPPRSVPLGARVTLCYGARSADLMAGVDDFEKAGIDVRLCTEDGSRGKTGFVTELLKELLDENQPACIVTCGPEPMLKAVSEVAAQYAVSCQVSLETPMACGIGICFSCVAKVNDDDGTWDYKRTCVEGPVFDAKKICWDQGADR